MIYTELTKKAMQIMFDKHKDQIDKSGIPYVFHPWHVAEQMTDEESTVVALLHDIVEDTDMTLEELKQAGFPESITTAVAAMTHPAGMDYMEYVRNVAKNPIAVKVKLADLEHNMDDTRLYDVSEKRLEKKKKYEKAMEYLKSLTDDK